MPRRCICPTGGSYRYAKSLAVSHAVYSPIAGHPIAGSRTLSFFFQLGSIASHPIAGHPIAGHPIAGGRLRVTRLRVVDCGSPDCGCPIAGHPIEGGRLRVTRLRVLELFLADCPTSLSESHLVPPPIAGTIFLAPSGCHSARTAR